MRNPELDIVLDIDKHRGELQFEERRPFRMIFGQKIWQIDEVTQRDRDLSLIIARYRIRKHLNNNDEKM